MEKTPLTELNGSAPPGEVFAITDQLTGKTCCVRDLLPEQLVAYAKDMGQQRQQALQQALQLTGILAILEYEMDRRSRSIAIVPAVVAVMTS